MKILFLEQFSELGGGQRNLLDLLPAVMERGWSATVAAPGDGPMLERARVLGAETERISIGEYSSGKKTAGDAARFLIDTFALGRWIGRHKSDVLSAGGARLMPAVARGAHGRPVIFQAQHFLGKSYAVALATRAIRETNATVIANSDHVASQFRPFLRCPVRIVYNGTPEMEFREPCTAVRRGSLSAMRQRIGIIGRIAPMKGQTDFLKAARIVLREFPQAEFVICGAPMFTSQSYVDEVDRLADGLPVEFLGWRDDVDAVLRDLDLLVAPSTEAEATTRVILEAFSAGVPVVAYAIGGIPEIVRDGETGFLTAEREPAALARRMVEMMGADRAAITRRAREEWEARFTLARYQREMTDAIEAAVAESAPHAGARA